MIDSCYTNFTVNRFRLRYSYQDNVKWILASVPPANSLPITGSPRNIMDLQNKAIGTEIQHISLHNLRPLILHGYIGPFLVLYGLWLYMWVVVYGVEGYFEGGLIAVAIIGLLQILCCLFCHWFVGIRCALTCSKVCLQPLPLLPAWYDNTPCLFVAP